MTDDELKRLLEANAERIQTGLEKRFNAIDGRFEALDKKFDSKFEALDKKFDDKFEFLDKKIDDKTLELRLLIEHQNRKFDLLADGLANIDEKLDRKISAVETRMEQGFADTQAMIKFSHADLDRRLQTLEEKFASLQVRVERLESTTTTH